MLFPLNKENVYLCAIMLTHSEKRVKKYKRHSSISLESLIDQNYVCALITGN